MVDQLRRLLALGLPDRVEDAALGHPAEEVGVGGRPDARHVEPYRLREPVGVDRRLGATVPGLVHRVDGMGGAVRE